MKKVSVYNSDFSNPEDWNDFLEELEYPEEVRKEIEEVELTVQSANVPDSAIEENLY